MKINYKILTAAFATALLTACGGGGGGGGGGTGGGGGGITGITQPDNFKNLTGLGNANLAAYKLEVTGTNITEPTPGETTYNAAQNREDNPADFPGFYLYKGKATVSPTGGGAAVSVDVWGLQHKTGGKAVIILDQNGGVAHGGLNVTGTPAGQHTYTGWNAFRLTENATGDHDSQTLQTGSFTLKANFDNGTGDIVSDAKSNIYSPNSDGDNVKNASRLSGNIRVGTFEGGQYGFESAATGGVMAQRQTITQTATGVDGNPVPDGAAVPVTIVGRFHGAGGTGVSAVYHHTSDNQEFHGALAGERSGP